MMKMIDLALSSEERDADSSMLIGHGGGDEPCYSCASFTLDDKAIQKLDLDGEGVERGDSLHFSAIGKVTGMTDMPHGKCFYMQITHIGISDENQSDSSDVKSDEGRAKGRYGSDEEDDGA